MSRRQRLTPLVLLLLLTACGTLARDPNWREARRDSSLAGARPRHDARGGDPGLRRAHGRLEGRPRRPHVDRAEAVRARPSTRGTRSSAGASIAAPRRSAWTARARTTTGSAAGPISSSTCAGDGVDALIDRVEAAVQRLSLPVELPHLARAEQQHVHGVRRARRPGAAPRSPADGRRQGLPAGRRPGRGHAQRHRGPGLAARPRRRAGRMGGRGRGEPARAHLRSRLEPPRAEAPRRRPARRPRRHASLTARRPRPRAGAPATLRALRGSPIMRSDAMRTPARSTALPRRGVPVSRHPAPLRRSRVKKNFYSDNVSGASPEILQAIVDSNADDTAPYGADPVHPAARAADGGVLRDGGRRLPRRHRHGGERALRVDPLHAVRRRSTAPRSRTSTRASAAGRSSGRAATPGASRSPRWTARSPVATLVETIEAGALRAADPPGRALSLTQGTEAGTVYTRPRGAGAGGGRPRARTSWSTWTAPASPTRSRGSAARRPSSPGRPASISCRSAPRRTARSARRPSSSSIAASPRRCATAGAGPAITTRRCASCRPSWLAFLEDDLWLRSARHANAMAARVRQGLADLPGVRFPHPTEINFVLTALPKRGVGRPGRRRLQLLPPRRAPGRRRPDRVRLGHARSRRWTRWSRPPTDTPGSSRPAPRPDPAR